MPRRRRRVNRRLLLLIAAIVGAMVLYVLAMAWIQSWGARHLGWVDLLIPRSIDVVAFIWLFWVGSAIGSFLNVVAWRLPRGQSVGGRSYCPRCQTRLRARDNFPVFGWIALRGRCRTCRLPISPRYPIVEAAVGTSLTLIGIGQLYRLSLPGQTVPWHGGSFWSPQVDRQVMIMLLDHTVAVSLAWAYGLIRVDSNRLPSRLTLVGMGLLMIPMLAYPTLMVVPWQVTYPQSWNPEHRYLDAVVRLLAGLATAVILGRYLARGICPGADPKLDPLSGRTAKLIDLICIIAVVSIVVSWQATAAVLVLASMIAAWLRRWLPPATDALGRFAIAMPIALTVQLVLWRPLHQSGWWPTAGSPPWLILGWLAVLFFVPLWLHDPIDHSLGRGRN